MKKVFLSLLTLVTIGSISAASLQVNNPYSSSWQAQTQGNIDSVAFDIYPMGMITKFEMTIAFNPPQNYFQPTDTLEVIYNFELPLESIVTDAWLWIDGRPKPAMLLDKGTAQNTYETVVHRVRRDPLLLYKNISTYYDYYGSSQTNNSSYTAKIFPIKTNETRCMKISCLIPSHKFNTKTLINNICTSVNKPNLELRVHKSDQITRQTLNYVSYSQQPDVVNNYSFDSISFASYQTGKNQFYALAISPAKFLGIPHVPQKTIIIIDTALSINSSIADAFEKHFAENACNLDSVTFLTASNQSAKWLATNQNTMKQATGAFYDIQATFNYETILQKAFEIQKAQKEKCKIILLSSAFRTYYDYGYYYYYINYNIDSNQVKKAKSIIDRAKNAGLNPHDLYIVDLDKPQYSNTYYSYNDYYKTYYKTWSNGFLKTLNQNISGGIFMHFGYNFIEKNLQEIDQQQAEIIDFLSCQIESDKGILFAQYSSATSNQADYRIIAGQARGVDSITIRVSGLWNDSLFAKRVKFAIAKPSNDSTIKNVWAGMYLQNQESISAQTTTLKKEIIANSLEYHILSNYTAFLALEAGIEIVPCESCSTDVININRPILVSTSNINNTDNIVSSYPNPFSNLLTISITDIQMVDKIEICSIDGEIIKTISKADISELTQIDTQNFASGLYIVKIHLNGSTKFLKIIKQ